MSPDGVVKAKVLSLVAGVISATVSVQKKNDEGRKMLARPLPGPKTPKPLATKIPCSSE